MIALIIAAVVIAGFVIIEYNTLTNHKNRIEAAEVELNKYEESGTDQDIDNAKKYLNAVIRDYNNKVERFPGSLVANLFNFPRMHTDGFDEGL